MFDFRLQVFHTVAKRLNFTKASTELFISQPAVTKHIKELEEQFKTTLIERSGNKKISLTPAGEMLLAYADRLAAVYNELDFDMNLLIKNIRVRCVSVAVILLRNTLSRRYWQGFMKSLKMYK